MKNALPITLLLLASVTTGVNTSAVQAKFLGKKPKAEQPQAGKMVTTPSGLQYQDVVVGTGAMPHQGQKVTVHYTGWLLNGKKFDSSVDRGQPFNFTLGAGEVIKGWDEGVASMKIGGTRILMVPAKLGYGERGTPGGPIPPNATLKFQVQLLGAQ
ncbi:MAG TPA: FKBP-type peptidyl-prolyl cis-trans isomerase [Candidatus Obscuribacterales bacterium]